MSFAGIPRVIEPTLAVKQEFIGMLTDRQMDSPRLPKSWFNAGPRPIPAVASHSSFPALGLSTRRGRAVKM